MPKRQIKIRIVDTQNSEWELENHDNIAEQLIAAYPFHGDPMRTVLVVERSEYAK